MASTVQLQRCVLCKGETHEGTTTLEFEFDSVRVIIDGVPAMVCDSCDEAYINGPLGAAISRIAAGLAESVSASIREHGSLSETVVRTHINHHGFAPSLVF